MPADSMRALVVTTHGGREVLAVQERPVPVPGPGQVLIEVAASGVNFKDVYMREGTYPRPTPFVLGDECAGTIAAVGEGVDDVGVADLVVTAAADGAHAGFALAAAGSVVPVPAGVSATQAAAVFLQGLTAHYLVNSTYPVQAGDTALVHAAAGGVGQLLVQLIGRAGAEVIASVGSAAKAEIADRLGAAHVIRYDEVTELGAAVRALRPDGVQVVYDGVGAATFEASLASLARRGTLALFGASSGQVPPFDLQRLNPLGSLFVTRPTLADYAATRAELRWRAEEVFALLAGGELSVQIGDTVELERAHEAYAALEGRASTGKLLLIP